MAVLPDAQRFTPDDLRLGTVSGVFGVSGGVRLFLYNPATPLLDKPREVQLVGPDGARRTVTLRSRPGAGRRVLGEIAGVGSPEAAAALIGAEIVLPRSALPALPPGEWYHTDLLGAEVHTDAGRKLGALVEIHEGPGLDTWIVRGAGAEWWVAARADDVLEVVPGVRLLVRDHAPLPV
jgi:16S rRNA processing protein RimM